MYRMELYFGHLEDELYAVDSFFLGNFDPSWLKSELAFKILQDIDRAIEIRDGAILVKDLFTDKPTWISSHDLSSGTKALLIMLNTDEDFVCLTRCGENCAKWVIEIMKLKPLKCTLTYLMPFRADIPLHIINDNTDIETYTEYRLSFAKNYSSETKPTEESILYSRVSELLRSINQTNFLSELLQILPVKEYSDESLRNTVNAFLTVKGVPERV